MKSSERHHLKENELLTGIEQTAVWLGANRSTLLRTAVAVLALVVILGGGLLYWRTQTREGEAALQKALRTYHARVGKETTPPPGTPSDTEPRFDTAEERNVKALEELEKVAKGFSITPSARLARLYMAFCQVGLGRPEEAEKNFEEVSRKRGDLQYYVASQGLAGVKYRRGDAAAAIEIYRTLVEDPKNPIPKDQLLLQLGEWREKAGNLEEARRDYQRILDEYPTSPVRSEAESRRQLLEEKNDTDARAGSPS